MSMEVGVAKTHDHDEKDRMVSSSPDSGVCDLDPKAEDPACAAPEGSASPSKQHQSPPQCREKFRQTLDPFFYKYADNRRLTLLKSLSQDSEYSLDTSLFDAEEFLQDMGFAGSSDPTIPDRFLPSLMQRLSKFPESEMESLHDRIIQSIGCFRRKEGKRRLFRNLSMGKDSRTDRYGRGLLTCPNNGNYPLLRSNTGPAEFPFDDATTSAYEASNSLQSSRLSSSDSGHQSMDSLKNEGELPESPIAILVSSASMEMEDRSPQEDTDKGVQVSLSEEETVADDASSVSVDKPSTVKQVADGEFMSTVEELQKLTNQISDDGDGPPQNKDNDDDPELTELCKQSLLVGTGNSGSDAQCANACLSEENSMMGLVTEIPDRNRNEMSASNPDTNSSAMPSSDGKVQPSPTKRPLRRISNAQSYNPLGHSRGFGSLEHQNKIDEDGDTSLFGVEYSGSQTLVAPSKPNTSVGRDDILFESSKLDAPPKRMGEYQGISSHINEAAMSGESVSPDFPPLVSSDTDSSGISAKRVESSQSSRVNSDICDSKAHGRTRPFSKPKFTRDDSLSNFLSSMLDMTDRDSVSNLPENPPKPLAETQSKSDSEILEDSHPSVSFAMQKNANKARSNETLSKTCCASPFSQERGAEFRSLFHKSPNRKRRVLRRMSSSLQCCDDEDCDDPDRLNMTSSVNFPPPSRNTFASIDPRPKLVPMNANPVHLASDHRVVHACSSLPAMHFCNPRKVQGEKTGGTNKLACASERSTLCNSDPEGKKFCNRRKERRNCKKRRYLSCPSPEGSMNFSPQMFPGSRELLNSIRCDHDVSETQYHPNTSFCPEAGVFPDSSYLPVEPSVGRQCVECGHSLYKNSLVDCKHCVFPSASPFQLPLKPKNDMPLSAGNSPKYCMWNSAPDVRHGFYGMSPKHGVRRRTPLHSVADVPLNHGTDFGVSSPVCDHERFSDDVFSSDRSRRCCCCFFNCDHHLSGVQTSGNKWPRVRMPQRQNSMSIDDPEQHTLPGWHAEDRCNHPLQGCIPHKNGCLLEGCCTEMPPSSACSSRNAVSSSENTFEVLLKQKKVEPLSGFTPFASREKRPSRDSRSRVKEGFGHLPESSGSSNKSEAMLERKIRIFSKFFTNLGNLSQSMPDRPSDKRHKEMLGPKFSDVSRGDKRCQSNVRRSDFCVIPPRKCATPPPGFDRLLDFFSAGTGEGKSSDDRSSELFEASNGCSREVGHPVYENKVVLQAKPSIEGNQRLFEPTLFTSSVSMYVNSEENDLDSNTCRNRGTESLPEMVYGRDSPSTKSDESSKASASQMSFKAASKELVDLQLSIQKAKEMRMSASKELHLLQDLLSGDAAEGNHDAVKEKRFATVYPGMKDTVLKSTEITDDQALRDLREKSKKQVLEDTPFWQEELKRVKEETDQAWQARLDRMEARLVSQEEELRRLQADNESLQKSLEMQRLGSPTCHCKSDSGQNGFGRIDSAFEDDEEYFSHKPSTPIQLSRQECDRLRERLKEAEQTADQLNLLLNQKLIELNKLQINFSKQTKEMIELEKSYLQLQCRLRRGTSKPVVERLCSLTSPFASKNLCPKPSPPATPQPNGVS